LIALYAYLVWALASVTWAILIEQVAWPALIRRSGMNVDPDIIVELRFR
jgi:hypothetical protein